MTEMIDIKAAVEAAARKGLAPTEVVSIEMAPYVGADGDELLRITIVVPDQQFEGIDGTHFLSALLNITDSIRATGDDRRPLIGYSTPSELADNDDPES